MVDKLRRLPGGHDDNEPQGMSVAEEEAIPDVSDRSYEVGVINSNEADLNRFSSCKFQENGLRNKPDSLGFDMASEQLNNPELYTVKTRLETDQAKSLLQKKYMILDNIYR